MKTKFCALVLAGMLVAAAGCDKNGEVLREFSFVASDSVSVFSQTRARFEVGFDSTAMGVFVKSINQVENTKTAYWLFFVNSVPAKEAANTFIPQAGDTINWRLISGY